MLSYWPMTLIRSANTYIATDCIQFSKGISSIYRLRARNAFVYQCINKAIIVCIYDVIYMYKILRNNYMQQKMCSTVYLAKLTTLFI